RRYPGEFRRGSRAAYFEPQGVRSHYVACFRFVPGTRPAIVDLALACADPDRGTAIGWGGGAVPPGCASGPAGQPSRRADGRAAAVDRGNGTATLDKGRVAAYLKPIAAALRAPAQDAGLSLSGGQAVLTTEVPGLELDLDGALARVLAAAADPANRVVNLPLK